MNKHKVEEEPCTVDPWVEQEYDEFKEALLEGTELPNIFKLVAQEAASENANLSQKWVQETIQSICTSITPEL